MAVNNRTDAISQVISKIVATVTNVIHRDVLNNEIINSIVFRKDVITTLSTSGGAANIDYVSADLIAVTTINNITFNFSSIENGDVKYLSLIKPAAITVAFAGATDVSKRKTYINTTVTYVIYKVSNKDGNISVESINIDNDLGPELFNKILDIGAWNMDANVGSTPVAHGLNLTKIREVTAMVINDADTYIHPLAGNSYIVSTQYFGHVEVSATHASCSRVDLTGGGVLDNIAYQNAVKNRGWIIIKYVL